MPTPLTSDDTRDAVEPDGQQLLLVAGASRLGVSVSDVQAQKILDHLDLLAHWNRRLNLTAITARGRVLSEHVLDSLSIAPYLDGERVLDIGSGGGFPGIPLAIACPETSFTLLDSRGKRVEFLRHVVARLALANVSVVKSRVEDYRPAEKFDTLVCRAFASLQEILVLTRALQRPDTRLLAMKGRMPADELGMLPSHVVADAIRLDVPQLDAERHLIRIGFAALIQSDPQPTGPRV